VLAVIFVGLALWPFVMPSAMQRTAPGLLVFWSLSCVVSALFMTLPVVSHEDLLQSTAGGVLLVVLGLAVEYVATQTQHQEEGGAANVAAKRTQHRRVVGVQLALILAAVWVVADTSVKLAAKEGLPLFNQVLSWFIFVASLVLPFWQRSQHQTVKSHFLDRLNVLLLGFGAPLVILSISYEVLFYSCLSSMLLCWLYIERSMYAHKELDPLAESSDVSKENNNCAMII